MPLGGGNGVATDAPAAERTLATIRRQRRRLGTLQILAQLSQSLAELATET
jgi:hypothetical protein